MFDRFNIKRSLRTAAVLATLAAFSACSIDDAQEIALVKLGSPEKEFTVEAEATVFDFDVYTNGPFHIERVNESDWLTLSVGEPEDGKAKITADCEFNESFKRLATIVLCSDVDSRKDTLSIRQKSLLDATITFEGSSITVAGAGGTATSAVKTNVPFSEMTVDIQYSDENSTDWITGLTVSDEPGENQTMSITTAPNTDPQAPRVATVAVSFTDGWGETVKIEFNLLQRTSKETLGRDITFPEFREKYALDRVIEEYVVLEGIVVSNKDSNNAGENTQITTSSIDYTVSKKTAYVESLDGRFGVCITTASEDDNVFVQYDKVKVLLYGAKGILKMDPDRYEITGVTKAMVVDRVSGSASDVPLKEKHIGDLTDEDIYTFVKLTDVEIPVRKGSITPINEGYAIGTNAHRIAKVPLLIRGIGGESMYIYTNTNCTYRSDGTRLPYGSGKIGGVIVHERFSRYDWREGADPAEIDDDPTLGFIGRYQIRHQNKSDIWGEMNDSVEDSFSAILTEYRYWNPDKTNKVQKPTYGTNGWFDHTYSEKYTGSADKQYLQAANQQHMFGSGTYDYLGPVGNNASYQFGANFGNKNGVGIVIDPAKEFYNSDLIKLVSFNPDGTIEWCGPYAEDSYAASGKGGWPGNDAIPTDSQQINYSGSTSMRGKANTSGSCYLGFGNHYWWDDDTDRFYSWLFNFSTKGISTSHISMQVTQFNSSQSFFAPRYWTAEWSYTDSQDPKDDDQWHKIADYTVPDVSVWANTLYSSSVAFKSMNFELPLEILDKENVYIRLHPVNDICSNGADYANARLNQSAHGAALYAEHSSTLGYFAVRYNK